MNDRPPSRSDDPRGLRRTAPIRPTSPSGPAVGPALTPLLNGRHPATRRAVAISYDPANADAPVVTAAGQGLVADEIIRRAREAGVPVTEDPKLAAILSQIDVGRAIPPELYAVIAEVLAYVYRLEDRISQRRF
jgi:flagellar biosynthesis protein